MIPGDDPCLNLASSVLQVRSHLMIPSPRIGAAYGSRYSIWDLSNLQGGKPNISGPGFAEGGHQFR